MSKFSKTQHEVINEFNWPSPKIREKAEEKSQNEIPPSIKLYSLGEKQLLQSEFLYSNMYKMEEDERESAKNFLRKPPSKKDTELKDRFNVPGSGSRRDILQNNTKETTSKTKFVALESHQLAMKEHPSFQLSEKIEKNSKASTPASSNRLEKGVSFIQRKHDKLSMMDNLSCSSSKTGSRTQTPDKNHEGAQAVDGSSPRGSLRRFQMVFKKLDFEQRNLEIGTLGLSVHDEIPLNQPHKRDQCQKNQRTVNSVPNNERDPFLAQSVHSKQQNLAHSESQNKNLSKAKVPPKKVAGDWLCSACNNINFARRTNCNSCSMPKPYEEILKIRSSLLGPPGLFKDTDWQCFNCLNVNFQKRENCNRCQALKPQEYLDRDANLESQIRSEILEEDTMKNDAPYCSQSRLNEPRVEDSTAKIIEEKNEYRELNDIQLNSSSKPFVKAINDWNCSFCHNINFARRTNCNICNMPKPMHEILKTKSSFLGPPGLFKDTDWQCFDCRNINFAKRVSCNRCNAPKPQEYIERELNRSEKTNDDESKSHDTIRVANPPKEISFASQLNKKIKANSDGHSQLVGQENEIDLNNANEGLKYKSIPSRKSRFFQPSQKSVLQRQQPTNELLKDLNFDKLQIHISNSLAPNEQTTLQRERSRSFAKEKQNTMQLI